MDNEVGVWEFELRVRVRGWGEREKLSDEIREAIASAVKYRYSVAAIEGIDEGSLVFADGQVRGRSFGKTAALEAARDVVVAGGGACATAAPKSEPLVCPDIAGRDL